ncbi:hypothetical protein POTOM_047753 [Populus tomentosa]|uniref:Uncharacterized protein n=1 Tax=Populus tomentosa TaxID=118781 RepID=A0A8X8CB88_POPTO|nr:hypothetical protein POTOM_047753 [Populus tomentosa]
MEVEAVLAVYGDDCANLDYFPPHLHLHIKPRTVDISSQQLKISLRVLDFASSCSSVNYAIRKRFILFRLSLHLRRRGINNCSIGLHCVFLLFVEAVIGIKASPEVELMSWVIDDSRMRSPLR